MPTSRLIFTLKHYYKSGTQIHQVHAQAITSGLFSLYPSHLLSHILHSFTSSSPQRNTTAPSKYDIVYCTNIFNLFPNPSTFNYNDIIKAHTVLHSPRAALILFLEMRRRPIAPNSHTFNFVLKACGLLQNSHYLAKALHAHLTKFEFSDNVYVLSTLCCTYGKSGDVDGAERVFKGSSFRNVVSYNVMINIFFKAGEFNRARDLFDEMSISLRDEVSYTAMIDGLFKEGDTDRAKDLFDEMPHSFRDVVSYNAMIDGLSKGGEIDRASELFDEMPTSFRNVVSYTAMIDGLSKGGEIDRARELFDEMPTSFKNVVSYTAMIDGLFKAGDTDRAKELFDEMPHSFRNIVSYTAMIDGLSKGGEIDRARELFDEMSISLRNVVSYTAMIDGHFKAGDIDRARDLFDEMPHSFRNVVSYNAMIDGLFKAGDTDRAKELFDEMPTSFRNVVSYNAMLMGLAFHGHGGSVLEQFLSRMLEDGVKADGVTILGILVGCSHSGLINDAKRIFVEMESVYGVPREPQHYRCMVDLLARAGLIKEAREMIEGMPVEGIAKAWGALLGGCKTHGYVEVAEEAAQNLMQLKPQDGGVKQLVEAVEKYEDIQNCASSRASLMDLRKVCNVGMQIAGNMELPLVNDLGYPKRFIRCLQIAEVVNRMKDLMAFSQDTKMGAIECLNNYSRGRKIGNEMTGNQGMVLAIDNQKSSTFHEQPGYGLRANGCLMAENGAISGSESSGFAFINFYHQFLGQNSSAAVSMRKNEQAVAFVQFSDSHFHKEVAPPRLLKSQSSEWSQSSHQTLVDKMLHEMLAASRGKSAQENYRRLNNDAAQQSNQARATSKELRYSESSNAAATAQVNSMNASTGTSSVLASRCSRRSSLAVKAEPCSRELLPEAFQRSASCFSKLEGFGW